MQHLQSSPVERCDGKDTRVSMKLRRKVEWFNYQVSLSSPDSAVTKRFGSGEGISHSPAPVPISKTPPSEGTAQNVWCPVRRQAVHS